jgi:selenide,water dikinase
VHPDRVWRNGGGRVGDALVLTKALGTGVVANAIRKDAAPADVERAAVASMTELNAAAAARLHAAGGPHAATDVTGFGLVGHLHELAAASGLQARVRADALPILPGVRELVVAGFLPGGSRRNRTAAERYATFAAGVDPVLEALACDAQTSGGLLAALPADRAAAVGTVIGHLEQGPAGRVLVD